MSGQSQWGGSAPWNSQDSSSPSVPVLRYGFVVKSKMATSMFQKAKWRKDGEKGPFLLSFKDSGCHHIILLASYWPKLSLMAITAMEAKNCSLYFSGQLS